MALQMSSVTTSEAPSLQAVPQGPLSTIPVVPVARLVHWARDRLNRSLSVPSTHSGFIVPLFLEGEPSYAATILGKKLTNLIYRILADTWLGRFNTILIFSVVCLVGHIILVGTATPASLANPSGAVAGLVVSICESGLAYVSRERQTEFSVTLSDYGSRGRMHQSQCISAYWRTISGKAQEGNSSFWGGRHQKSRRDHPEYLHVYVLITGFISFSLPPICTTELTSLPACRVLRGN
jgi:hypothetical protein